MINLPLRVKAEFLKMKKASAQYIEIKHIKGYFFVYQSTSRWDKEKKKPIKVPTYLGRITTAGKFIEAKKRKPRVQLQQTISIAEEQMELGATQKSIDIPDKVEKKSKYEEKILMALSMNGRMSMSVLGKMVGLKETAISGQVRKLERKYGIRYIAEIDTSKLDYIQFLITVKFLENFPRLDELKGVFSKDPRVQLVLVTKGEFDLIVYALAKDSEEINLLVLGLRTNINYRSVWNAAPAFDDYGFIPLRSEFIDFLKDKLLIREYAVLKELNKAGKMDFSEIDKLYGFDRGRSQYSYYRLKEKNVIKRITITMESLPIKYISVIFEDTVNWKQFKTNREKSLKDILSETSTPINKYLLVDDIVSPNGSVIYLPVFNDGDLEYITEHRATLDLGINTRTFVVLSSLIGNFCYRNFDGAYSIQNRILVKEYDLKSFPKIDYEETGRIKKEPKRYTKDIRGLAPENF